MIAMDQEQRIAKLEAEVETLKRQKKSDGRPFLAIPLLVISAVVAIIVVYVMLWVIPRFDALFKDMNIALPTLTILVFAYRMAVSALVTALAFTAIVLSSLVCRWREYAGVLLGAITLITFIQVFIILLIMAALFQPFVAILLGT